MRTGMKKLFPRAIIVAALGLMPAGRMTAQTFTTLHSFGGINYNDSYGVGPQGGLVLSGNFLYGTTSSGGNSGPSGDGTVFTYNVNGTGFKVLYNFAGGSYGQNPIGAMALSGSTLIGTTEYGGKTGGNLGVSGNGTVFKVNTDGTGFTNLYMFGAEVADYALGVYTNGDGMFPQAGVIESGNTVYGTAAYGGTNGSGTVFAVNTNGTGFAVLHTFRLLVQNSAGVYTNSGGARPVAGLVLSGNTLYGTTSIGGTNGSGTVFAVNTDGTGFTNLYNFAATRQDVNLGSVSTNSSGANPLAALMLSGNTLYGAAEHGGTNGSGTLFSINTNGTGFAVLHSFQPTAYNPSSLTTNSEGANPVAGLFLLGNTLYGTAGYGGTNGYGTAFAINTDGTGFTNLYTFAGLNDGAVAQQGSFAFLSSGTFVLSGGALYAAAPGGGTNGNGTVFGVNTNGTGITNVYSFGGYFTNIEGIAPLAGLISSGNTLYGTTSSGGTNNNGTVFAINNDGTGYTNIYSFSAFGNYNTNSDGANPAAGLVLSGNTLYGTANNGGTNGAGTVFKVNTDGTGFKDLYSFSGFIGTDGANPQAGLVLSGNTLYGTASFGGSSFGGTIFAIHTDGTGFTNLYGFTGGNDGAQPMAGLVLSGNCLYGTVSQGGTNFFGAVFAVNTNGTANGRGYTNLYSFSGSFANDGDSPMAGLYLSGNTLYGTTSGEFSGSYGTVFAIHTDGTGYTNLYNFTGGSAGANPVAGLYLSGSALYGTTSGKTSGYGTVFAVNTNGTANGTGFTNLYSFAGGLNGANPQGGIIMSGNTLYGTAQNGGGSSDGTVFSLSLGPVVVLTPPAITSIALSGANLVINGSNGQSGGTYETLTTTNLTLGPWTPVATNILNVSGIFTFTATNVVNGSTDPQRFYRIVQTQ